MRLRAAAPDQTCGFDGEPVSILVIKKISRKIIQAGFPDLP
jgi:hypothetical protein